MLQLADGVAPTLLVVKDHTGAVFGGFAEGAWRRSGDRYYGEAGTFVFRLLPGGAGAQGFHWRGKNRYFMLCNQEGLALGGGGHFALFLDPDFYHGSSGACTTFESPPLCGEEAGSPSPPSHPPRPPVPPGAAAPPGSAAAGGGGGGDSRAFTCQEVELWAVRPATAPPLASRIRDRAHSFGN
uniref:Oxidation resistance protein 1 n=2 Tax=Heterosigma akashiwo TaxID=2829 RepID=A0A7S4DL73_HETAK